MKHLKSTFKLIIASVLLVVAAGQAAAESLKVGYLPVTLPMDAVAKVTVESAVNCAFAFVV